MPARFVLAAAVFAALIATSGTAGARTCTEGDLNTAVDATGAALRKLNAENQPALQRRVRELAAKRGWGEAEAEERGMELVEDDETRRLDKEGAELFLRLDQLASDPAAGEPCARLDALNETSQRLLSVTRAKGAYISARLDAALKGDVAGAKPPAAVDPTSSRPPVAAGQPARTPPQARPPAPRKPWLTETDVAILQPAPQTPPPVVPAPSEADLQFTSEDIQAAGRGFFGSISAGLASVIEYAFQQYGRPNGYILGTEGGAAFLAGLRYGDGRLVTKLEGERPVFWQGPSVGYDVGIAGSRVMFLVYNLDRHEGIFARFAGIDGSAYLVGGVGITFLKKGPIILAPIRSGLGLRVGANLGYLKFTPRPSINPF